MLTEDAGNQRDNMTSTASRRRSDAASSEPWHSPVLPPLIHHVFTAVNAEITHLLPVTCGMQNIATQPRAILALLVYHYAVGVLSSHDIESALWRDVPLRLLCHNAVPDWRELRRFRRINRDAVRRCLTQVLAASAASAIPSDVRPAPSRAAHAPWEDEAEQRINTAILLDHEFADE